MAFGWGTLPMNAIEAKYVLGKLKQQYSLRMTLAVSHYDNA